MGYDDVIRYAEIVKLALLGFVLLLALIKAIRRSRARVARRDLVVGIMSAVFVMVIGMVASDVVSWLYTAVLLALGLVIGLALGGVRPLVAWVVALCTVYFAIALMWDQGGSFAIGHAVLGLAAGMELGQAVMGKVRGGGPAPAPPAVPQPAPPA